MEDNSNMTEIIFLIATVLSALATIFLAIWGFRKYKLSKKIRDEQKSDETIIVSKFIRANLEVPDHDKCVIKCTIFNKSKRKAYISKVNVYGKSNVKDKDLLNVAWSNKINDFGEPIDSDELIGIVDKEELYIRQDTGEEIDFCRIEIFHSFSSTPITTFFDSYSNG